MNTLTELGERVIESEKQRDQLKAERDTLIDDIAVLKENVNRLERENERLFYSLNEMTEHDKGMCELADKLRAENKALRLQANTYFDEWQTVKKQLKEENEKLERENEKLKATNENLNNRVRNLNLNGQIQHDELMSCDGEVNYWKNLYTTLTNHIRLKAEMNPSVSRYIDLVNYIDRLERVDDEKI